MRCGGHVARVGEGRKVYTVLMGKAKGKNHLTDRSVDGDEIGIDVKETGSEGLEWIHLAQDTD
jgi:hypothetical protein